MRIIGLDIHRVFAEAVALEDGTYRRLGRVSMTREHFLAFAATPRPTDHVIVEATGNATAVLEILAPRVARVAVANPLQVHLIARAKTKTDKIDARVLARLYAAGFLPEVWVPDERTLAGSSPASDPSQPVGEEPGATEGHRAVDPARPSRPSLPPCGHLRRQGPRLVAGPGSAG